MVERTAHNGFAAGSNPAKPKMNNLKLKTYQLKKLKHYLKKTNLIFFFYIANFSVVNQLELEQKLFKNNLELYKIKNTLLKHSVKQSVFTNISPLIKGPLCIVKFNNNKSVNLNFQTLLNLNNTVPILAIKLNKKIYSNVQVKTISTLNYTNNIKILNKTFTRLLKIPYYKFKN